MQETNTWEGKGKSSHAKFTSQLGEWNFPSFFCGATVTSRGKRVCSQVNYSTDICIIQLDWKETLLPMLTFFWFSSIPHKVIEKASYYILVLCCLWTSHVHIMRLVSLSSVQPCINKQIHSSTMLIKI